MRKIVNSTFISLDGVMEHMEKWHFGYIDESTTEIATLLIRRCDAALFGRLTYEIYAAHWPGQTGEFADRLNEIQRYVASTTLAAGKTTPLDLVDTTTLDNGVVVLTYHT